MASIFNVPQDQILHLIEPNKVKIVFCHFFFNGLSQGDLTLFTPDLIPDEELHQLSDANTDTFIAANCNLNATNLETSFFLQDEHGLIKFTECEEGWIEMVASIVSLVLTVLFNFKSGQLVVKAILKKKGPLFAGFSSFLKKFFLEKGE